VQVGQQVFTEFAKSSEAMNKSHHDRVAQMNEVLEKERLLPENTRRTTETTPTNDGSKRTGQRLVGDSERHNRRRYLAWVAR
jgi:hypothetical protein